MTGCRVLVAVGWAELYYWVAVCLGGPRVESLGREVLDRGLKIGSDFVFLVK